MSELYRHFVEAEKWVCECGEHADPLNSKWRWNGRNWEHHHGYPIGHVCAEKDKVSIDGKGGANETAAK